MKRAVVNANYEQGGLKIISVQDMQNTFLIKWVKNLILPDNTKWATIAYSELNRLGGDLSIFHSNVDYKELEGLALIKNKFWKSAWVEHNSNLNVTHDLVPMYRRDDQRLWNNSNILYKGKVLFFPQWIKAGVFTVGYLFDESGAFCSIDAVRERVGAYPNLWFECNALYNALPPEWKEKSETLQVTSKRQFWDNDITGCDNNSIQSKIVSQYVKCRILGKKILCRLSLKNLEYSPRRPDCSVCSGRYYIIFTLQTFCLAKWNSETATNVCIVPLRLISLNIFSIIVLNVYHYRDM